MVSGGNSYDNALAETIKGLYKTELFHRRVPWKTKESLELATLQRLSYLTTTDYLNQFYIYPLPKLEKATIGNLPVKPPQRNYLNQRVSIKHEAIHASM